MGPIKRLFGGSKTRPQAGVGTQVQPHHQTAQSPYHRGGTGVANGRKVEVMTHNFYSQEVANNLKSGKSAVLIQVNKDPTKPTLYVVNKNNPYWREKFLKDGTDYKERGFIYKGVKHSLSSSDRKIIFLDQNDYYKMRQKFLSIKPAS